MITVPHQKKELKKGGGEKTVLPAGKRKKEHTLHQTLPLSYLWVREKKRGRRTTHDFPRPAGYADVLRKERVDRAGKRRGGKKSEKMDPPAALGKEGEGKNGLPRRIKGNP